MLAGLDNGRSGSAAAFEAVDVRLNAAAEDNGRSPVTPRILLPTAQPLGVLSIEASPPLKLSLAGMTRRWPATSRLGFFSLLAAATLAVGTPKLLAMAPRLSPA